MTAPVAEGVASKVASRKAVQSSTLPGEKTIAARSKKKSDGDDMFKLKYNPIVRTGRALRSGSRYEQALKAEWIFGIFILLLMPLSKPELLQNFAKWMGRLIAWTAVFIMLLLIASAGPRIARICAAFGGLALLSLFLNPTNQNGTVTFTLDGVKAVQAATDKLGSITGTSSSSSSSGTDAEKTIAANESKGDIPINLGDGMGVTVYRESNKNAGIIVPETMKNLGGNT